MLYNYCIFINIQTDTCAVQILLVAFSRRMCCSLVCSERRNALRPAASLHTANSIYDKMVFKYGKIQLKSYKIILLTKRIQKKKLHVIKKILIAKYYLHVKNSSCEGPNRYKIRLSKKLNTCFINQNPAIFVTKTLR